jgi:hypothetical protein
VILATLLALAPPAPIEVQRPQDAPATQTAPEPTPTEEQALTAAPIGPPTAEPAPPPAQVASPPQVTAPPPPAPAPYRIIRPNPRPPWDGSGRIVGGSFLAAGGASLVGLAISGIAMDPSPNGTLNGILGIVSGLALSAGGASTIVGGARTRRRFGEFVAGRRIDPPPQGSGLIVGGAATLAPSLVIGIVTMVVSLDPRQRGNPVVPVMYSVSGAGLVAGATMLGIGIHRRRGYERWVKHQVSPSASLTPKGATVGISGRF